MSVLLQKLVKDDSSIKVLKMIGTIQSVLKETLGNSKGINTKLQGIDGTQEISVVHREYLEELLGYSDDELVELDKFIKLYDTDTTKLLLLLLEKIKKEDRSVVFNALYEKYKT